MIFGVGLDLAKCSRFEKWIKSPGMIERFFHPKELWSERTGKNSDQTGKEPSLGAQSQHYAARFAAKEAFSKALGTGLVFDLKDLYIKKEKSGKPSLVLENTALEALKKYCPNWESAKIFVSLSHEKEFAAAQVIIET